MKTRVEFVTRLERIFKPRYVPAFSELKFAAEEKIDFDPEFDDLIQPLLDQKLLFTDDQEFRLTQAGKSRADAFLRVIRFRQGGWVIAKKLFGNRPGLHRSMIPGSVSVTRTIRPPPHKEIPPLTPLLPLVSTAC